MAFGPIMEDCDCSEGSISILFAAVCHQCLARDLFRFCFLLSLRNCLHGRKMMICFFSLTGLLIMVSCLFRFADNVCSCHFSWYSRSEASIIRFSCMRRVMLRSTGSCLLQLITVHELFVKLISPPSSCSKRRMFVMLSLMLVLTSLVDAPFFHKFLWSKNSVETFVIEISFLGQVRCAFFECLRYSYTIRWSVSVHPVPAGENLWPIPCALSGLFG